MTPEQKSFCVLQLAKSESVITVQRAFRIKFHCNPPSDNNIRRWYRQFEETGCLCKGKSPGRPKVSEERVEQVREAFVRSPKKSVRRASRELAIPVTSVWRVLRRRLHLHPYHLQLLQALKPTDYGLRANFATDMLRHDDEDFLTRIVFSDESTFHLSGKVNTHNVRIWGSENPHEVVALQRDSPKLNVFCAISKRKVYGPFFFGEKTVTGNSYLDMLQLWLFPQLQEEPENFIWQQDGAPPHWHISVRNWLNDVVPDRWIGRQGPDDRACFAWPPRSPDLTHTIFFCGYL